MTPLIKGPSLQAPAPDPDVLDTTPSLKLLGAEQVTANVARRRLRLQLETGKPCWGVMNFTGPLVAYSFAPGLPFSEVSEVQPPSSVSLTPGLQRIHRYSCIL